MRFKRGQKVFSVKGCRIRRKNGEICRGIVIGYLVSNSSMVLIEKPNKKRVACLSENLRLIKPKR